MAAQVRGIGGHRDIVADTHGNLAVASGADVVLDRLIRLYATYLYIAESTAPDVAHRG